MSLRYISTSQLADLSGYDRRTVSDRLVELKPYKKEKNLVLYDARLALPLIFAAGKYKGKDIEKDMKEQELRYETLRADKVELELNIAKGEYVNIEDVASVVEKEYTYVRATLLSIPSRRAKALALEMDPMVIQDLLVEDIAEALNHLNADKKYSEATPVENTEVVEIEKE
jgi:phage terminase Nu1 subunit (DNA packaging protein)